MCAWGIKINYRLYISSLIQVQFLVKKMGNYLNAIILLLIIFTLLLIKKQHRSREKHKQTRRKIFSNAFTMNETTSVANDRFTGPHPEGIMPVAQHVDHTRILSMRDAWSHLVGKCSETPPSNIETRTHQVDGERKGEREEERETEKPACT